MNFQTSLVQLRKEVPGEKVYVLQISDAYKPPTPLEDGVGKDGLRPRGRWSHDFRPAPFQGGAFTEQVVDVAKAVLGTGTRSWFSVEIFDGVPDGKGREYKVEDFTRRAMESHKKLLHACADV